MSNIFPIDVPLTIIWHLSKPDGTPFSLNGYSYRLFYRNGKGKGEAESTMVTASDDTISFVFPDSEARFAGMYALQLILFQYGKKFCTLNYNDAFGFARLGVPGDRTQDQESTGSVVHLYTTAEYYLFSPVIPMIGDDGYWYVNGEIAVDPSGEYISATRTMEYDPATNLIIIDRGRVDSEGRSIEQTITALADAMETAATDHETAALDHDIAVQDHLRASTSIQRADDDHARAEADHIRALDDHSTAAQDHLTALQDHNESDQATDRANAAAAAAEHMVDIHQGPPGPQGNTGSSVDYPFELVNSLDSNDSAKGLSAAMGRLLRNMSFNKIPVDTYEGAINTSNGTQQPAPVSRRRTDKIDVDGMTSIIYTKGVSSGTSSTGVGTAFYDSNDVFIEGSGVPEDYGAAKEGYRLAKISVPDGARYVRFTYWAAEERGLFFFADGDSDAIAKALYSNSHGTNPGAINTSNGEKQRTPASRRYTDPIDVTGMTSIIYTKGVSSGTSSTGVGTAFYDSNDVFIEGSGVPEDYGAAKEGYRLAKISVPDGARYVRFTYWAAEERGLFFFADGDSDAIAKAIYSVRNYDAKIEEIDSALFNKIPFTSSLGSINATTGIKNTSTNRRITDFVEVGTMESIIFTRLKTNSQSPTGLAAVAFYNSNQEFISSVGELYGQENTGYEISKVDIPQGAAYLRFAYWADKTRGLFYFADGDRDDVAKTLYSVKEYLPQYLKDTEIVKSLVGYESGVYGSITTEGGMSVFGGIKSDLRYGLGNGIVVNRGDKVRWSYGNLTIRTIALVVYDLEGNYVNYYANNVANERTIDSFLPTSQLESFVIRPSLFLANAKDSFLEVNDIRVWTAYDGTYSIADIKNTLGRAAAFEENALSRLVVVLEGAGNTFVSKTFSGIKPGKYRITLVNPDVSTSGVSTNTQVRFQVAVFDSVGVQTNLVNIQCTTIPNPLSSYYDFIVPEGTMKVRVGCRCAVDSSLSTYVEGLDEEFDATRLQKGTFNSSFNETIVEGKRREFCSLFEDKNTVESFMFFTDPHLAAASRYETMDEGVRDKYISALQKYYNSLPMDNCICGGDLINYEDVKSNSLDELGYFDGYMRKLFRNYRPCFGNHDYAPYTVAHTLSQVALTLKEVQNLWFREEGSTYYSFNGINTKFYVLNSGSSFVKSMVDTLYSPTINNIRWDQVNWFATKLLEDNAAYSVVVAHMYSNGKPDGTWYEEHSEAFSTGIFPFAKHIREVAIAYNNRGSITKNGITYDFSSATGRVLFYLCGHAHFDIVDMSMELPVVCTTDLEGGVWNPDTQTQDYFLVPTFDAMLIDNTNSILYAVRVGAGNSRIVNLTRTDVAVGGTSSLVTKLSGTISWKSDNADIVTVSSGTVIGVSSGCAGVIATDENGKEEYWLVKVS